MAGSLNKVCLLGNVGKDPELRSVGNGDKRRRISRSRPRKAGPKEPPAKSASEPSGTRSCAGTRGSVRSSSRYVAKGRRSLSRGSCETRKWQTSRPGPLRDRDRAGSLRRDANPARRPKREAGHGDRSSGGYDDRRSSSSPGGRPGSMSDHWTPPAQWRRLWGAAQQRPRRRNSVLTRLRQSCLPVSVLACAGESARERYHARGQAQ